MLLFLVLGIFIARSGELVQRAAVLPPLWCAAAVVGTIALTWLLAAAFAWRAVGRLCQAPDCQGPILRRYQREQVIHGAVLLIGYAALIYGLNWPAVVRQSWGLARWVLVDDLLILAPLLAGVALGWLAHFDVVRALRGRFVQDAAAPIRYSRWTHFDFLLRHQLGVVLLLPLLVLIAMEDVVALIWAESPSRDVAEVVLGCGSLATLLLGAPWMLRLVWRARPLGPGLLRTRLECLASRVGFRANDILIWDTRGMVVNAAVTGILPWIRYVFLSDALLHTLSDDEIESVFGHEIGHIHHRHLQFYMIFLLGATTLFTAATAWVTSISDVELGDGVDLSGWPWLLGGGLATLGAVAAYFGVFFGLVSRRFERQADLFACRAVSCGRPDCPPHREPYMTPASLPVEVCPTAAHSFAGALEKVALLNGIARDLPSWRHFSIAQRVRFVEDAMQNPHAVLRLDRTVSIIKSLLVLAFVASSWWLLRHTETLGALVQNAP
jgi:STE24 endopeptidase